MTNSFTFGELPAAPPAAVIAELQGYEIAWLSDSMDLNLMRSIRAISPAAGRIAGPAVTVTVPPGDFLLIAEALTRVRPGDVLVIDAGGEMQRAVWGEYFSGWARALGVAGVVIDGAVRDAADIETMGFPLFCRGTSARKPTMTGMGEVNVPISCGGACIIPGDIVVADSQGVIVVPLRHLDALLARARVTAARERSPKPLGERADYLAYFEKSFGQRIADIRAKGD